MEWKLRSDQEMTWVNARLTLPYCYLQSLGGRMYSHQSWTGFIKLRELKAHSDIPLLKAVAVPLLHQIPILVLVQCYIFLFGVYILYVGFIFHVSEYLIFSLSRKGWIVKCCWVVKQSRKHKLFTLIKVTISQLQLHKSVLLEHFFH